MPPKEKIPNNEFIPPNEAELIQMQINLDNIGTGETVHFMKGKIGMLRQTYFRAQKQGWTKEHQEDWSEVHGELNELIVKRKLEIAKEKGLL